MRTPLALLLSTSLALSYAASASAQPVDAATRATARQLGEEGMKAFDQGDCAAAVEKLTRAHDLVHVPTLAFYTGKCLEKLGRLVDAEEKYLEATRDPIDASAPGTVKAAQADADKARKALLPRIPSVVLTLQPPAYDAQVTLDGRLVPPAMIGVKRPIDPGAHTVQVQRYGGVASRQFTIQESEATSVVLDVPAAGAVPYPPGYAPGYPPPGYGPPPGPGYYVPGEPPVPMKRRNMGLFVSGCVLAPLGAVMAIAGGLLLLTEASAANDGFGVTTSKSTAPGYALVGVGLVGMAGGITIAVIGGKKVPVEAAPGAPPPPPAVSFEPLLGPGTAGLRVRF